MYFFAFRFQCNLTKDQEVTSALRGADCVYHLASYGMSGKEHVIRTLITCLACFLDGHLKKKKIGRKIGLKDCYFIRSLVILYWIKLYYSRVIFLSLLSCALLQNPFFLLYPFLQFNFKLIEDVNVRGTENVIQGNQLNYLLIKRRFILYEAFHALQRQLCLEQLFTRITG